MKVRTIDLIKREFGDGANYVFQVEIDENYPDLGITLRSSYKDWKDKEDTSYVFWLTNEEQEALYNWLTAKKIEKTTNSFLETHEKRIKDLYKRGLISKEERDAFIERTW